MHGGISLLPAFYGSRKDIHSFQQGAFGFYALRAGLRGVLLAVNYLIAANRLSDDKIYGPSVLCAYAAAFQGTHSWLALHGRVFVDPAYWPSSERTHSSSDEVKTVLAVLSINNKWCFQVGRQNHGSRWREVRDLAIARHELLPCYYECVFDAIYGPGCRHPMQNLDDLLTDGAAKAEPLHAVLEEPGRFGQGWTTATEVLEDLFSALPKVRHRALYGSFGGDLHLTNALVNGDATDGDLGAQADLFYLFASELLLDVSQRWLALVKDASPSKEVCKWLFVSTHYPWFDPPRIGMIRSSALRDMLTSLERAIASPDNG